MPPFDVHIMLGSREEDKGIWAASASPQECLGIILGAPGSSPAPEATLERGAPSKGSFTTDLEEMH